MNLHIRRVAVVLVMMLSLTGSLMAVAADRVAATIKVKSFNSMVADIETVARAIQTVPQGVPVSSNLAMVIDENLGTTGMTGIDRNAAFYLFILLPESEQGMTPSIVAVLPVTDKGNAVLKGMGTRYANTDNSKGYYYFSTPADGSDGNVEEMYASVAAKFLILSPNLAGVNLIAGHVAKGPLSLNAPAVSGTVQIALNISAVMPTIEKAVSVMAEQMKQIPPQANGVNPSQILAIEGQWFLRMCRQMKSVSLSMSADGKAIRIASDMVVIPGSTLDKIYKHLVPVSPKYAALLPADSLVAFASGGMNAWDDMVEPYNRFMEQVMAVMGADASKGVAAMRETILSTKGMYAGNMAAGVYYTAGQKGLGFVEYVAVKDPVKVRRLLLESISKCNASFGTLTKGVTLSIEPTRNHNKIEITPVRYSIDFNAMKTGPGSVASLPPLLKRLANFTCEYAFVGDTMVVSAFSESVMNTALDNLHAGGVPLNKSPLFTTLCPDANATIVSMYTVRLISMLKACIIHIGSIDPVMVSAIPESKSGLAGYTYTRGNEMISVSSLGMPEIVAMRDALPSMMGLLMLMQSAMSPSQPGMRTSPRGATGMHGTSAMPQSAGDK